MFVLLHVVSSHQLDIEFHRCAHKTNPVALHIEKARVCARPGTAFWTPHAGRSLMPSCTAALGFLRQGEDSRLRTSGRFRAAPLEQLHSQEQDHKCLVVFLRACWHLSISFPRSLTAHELCVTIHTDRAVSVRLCTLEKVFVSLKTTICRTVVIHNPFNFSVLWTLALSG